MMNRKLYGILVALYITLITFPYIFAWCQVGEGKEFAGFLANYMDGQSYIAKMMLGWRGEWKFTPLYSAETGEGAFLFTFYLFLGHVSRILSIRPIYVFHAARVLSAIFLIFTIRLLVQLIFRDQPRSELLAFILVTFGSGLGWAVNGILPLTSDFWVAEAYPFLSSFQNPHFPLGLGIMVRLLINEFSASRRVGEWFVNGLWGFLLAVILPFGVIVLASVYGVIFALDFIRNKKFSFRPIHTGIILGVFVVLYQYVATLLDPVLSGWNAQNITKSPGILDLLISFSPMLPIAIYGIWRCWKKSKPFSHEHSIFIIWLLVSLVLVIIPFPLQRRFLLGFHIPCVILGVIGLRELLTEKKFNIATPVLILIMIPTNLLLLSGAIYAGFTQEPALYISINERLAMDWINRNTPEGSVIFSSPEMGVFIPAYTGRKVVYGHLFETIDAESKKEWIIHTLQSKPLILDKGHPFWKDVDYIFWGAREEAYGGAPPDDMNPVFSNNEITIFLAAVKP